MSAEAIQVNPLIAVLDDRVAFLERVIKKVQGQRPIENGQAKPHCSVKVQSGTSKPEPLLLDVALKRYAERRRRAEVFGDAGLFGEPGWDILLDLYIAHATHKPVSVSSACIGSASPPTTGLRWLVTLEEAGLVSREPDPQDQRRILVHLSEEGISRMETFLRETSGQSAPTRQLHSKRQKRMLSKERLQPLSEPKQPLPA